MKVTDIINSKRNTLSFEIFPPKTKDNYEVVEQSAQGIAALHPDFMSVTYGAGGGTDVYTLSIAEDLYKRWNIPTIAHLSCISSSHEDIDKKLDIIRERGIDNILALRGDKPAGFTGNLEYKYASDLVSEIKNKGNFCVGGACYPEGHPESSSFLEDIDNLKRKVDAGCDFLTSQMFFENSAFYSFLSILRGRGIHVPVVAGVMPVTNANQIKRIISLSGAALPIRFKRIVDRYGDNPEAMKQAGIIYATEQIIDLYANGVSSVHVYSMNKTDVAAAIQRNLPKDVSVFCN
ncbi:MAG: methylenetetrahydrofolate reductase [Paludibacteraceae bacterium]|nr:methylenetetrahydrofolate reductase [Paludibacteraceae bacterium]